MNASPSRHPRAIQILSLLCVLCASACAPCLAGDLNPPVGPIAPTHKTLTEIEPRIAINLTNTPGDADSLFKITQPGSYYLAANITGVVGKHGIEIAADSVSLDLNGFAVINSGIGLDGVTTAGLGRVSITIQNGIVSAWGTGGIELVGTGHIVEQVHARVNNGHGIVVGSNAVVTNCQASGNQGDGIVAASNAVFSNCAAFQNNGNGLHQTGEYASIQGCTASSNSVDGIRIGSAGTVTNSAASSNGAAGIRSGAAGTIRGNSAYLNNVQGISVGNGSTVAECTVLTNESEGIQCVSSCYVRANTCTQNGFSTSDGANIRVSGTDTRVEGNNCSLADRGIEVNNPGNIIVRNTCSGNTLNWVIAANNVVGPILDRTAPASAAINGNSAPSSLGSTEPNANFSY